MAARKLGYQMSIQIPFWQMLVTWIKAEGQHKNGIHWPPSRGHLTRLLEEGQGQLLPSRPKLEDKQIGLILRRESVGGHVCVSSV